MADSLTNHLRAFNVNLDERTDAERLDWLERSRADVTAPLDPEDGWMIDWTGGQPWDEAAEGDTLREAIDAAMDATTEPEEEG